MLRILLALLVLAWIPWAPSVNADAEDDGRVLAFPEGLQWLNVSRPLTAEDLRGRVVILDFWTYGCVNCLHVAEDLRRLERRFGDRLTVVGVHTPKFDNEKNLGTLRNTLVRMDRRHPVVNDPDWELARRYGMRAWPTLVVFAPSGERLGRLVGEGHEERLAQAVGILLGLLDDTVAPPPLPLALEKDRLAHSLLAAPGKVAVSEDGERVAVSDTLHHRVILARADGLIQGIYGGPDPGLADGSGPEVRFHGPQGLLFQSGRLLVADTGNHAVRLIDTRDGRVTTLAGTGELGGVGQGEYDALQVALRSPWDLALDGDRLYIAMAGSHQIWRLGLTDGKIAPFAGSRREGIDEGTLAAASFSQPSGLVRVGRDLYVADAEASAVRRIRLDAGRVENLVGTGLFDFGDRDGSFELARLQHLAGIAALDPERLVVADSYNHRVKLLDLKARRVSRLLGTGEPGDALGAAGEVQLNEPGGLAVLNGKILVADTNNHRILFLDPATGEAAPWPLRLP